MMDQGARISRLERQVRWFRVYAVFATMVPLLAAFTSSRKAASPPEVLRVRGLIVVDQAGRDRILIGAPVPSSPARVRTDTARARQLWGYMSPKYMSWYEKYRHATHGIVVLDEHGIDRLLIGDSLADPNIGRRIGSDVGILVNDAKGFERTGYGVLTVDGRDRAVLGLDTNQGTEGVTLSVRDDGAAGLTVYQADRRLFVGADRSDPAVAGAPSKEFFGLVVKEKQVVRHEINVAAP